MLSALSLPLREERYRCAVRAAWGQLCRLLDCGDAVMEDLIKETEATAGDEAEVIAGNEADPEATAVEEAEAKAGYDAEPEAKAGEEAEAMQALASHEERSDRKGLKVKSAPVANDLDPRHLSSLPKQPTPGLPTQWTQPAGLRAAAGAAAGAANDDASADILPAASLALVAPPPRQVPLTAAIAIQVLECWAPSVTWGEDTFEYIRRRFVTGGTAPTFNFAESTFLIMYVS